MKYGYVEEDGTPVVTNSAKQGGIVAVYYLGTLIGCLLGGVIGDSIGRVKTVVVGCAWSVFGAALQCSAQNVPWMVCARLINGIGTGHLNAIVPVWAAEISDFSSRGAFIAQEFTLNIFGVVVAYWLEYGLSFIDGGRTQFRWRFPIAFQIIPLLLLAVVVNLMPESPRWLIKVGRRVDAEYILTRLRVDPVAARREADEIEAVVQLEKGGQVDGKESVGDNSYVGMFLGRGRPGSHIARRVQLVIWLQIVQEWVGIAAVTVYAPRIFSGVNNITYMLSTLVAVYTLDKIGRRWTLYWGAVGQGIAMFLAGGFSRLTFDAAGTSKQAQYGGAAAFFVFLYTLCLVLHGSPSRGCIQPKSFLSNAELAEIHGASVVGWSIGNGWLTLLTPVMFNAINEKTLYVFGACNVLAIPFVWAFYPETNQRTLEEMDLLFSADSIFAWEAEKAFAKLQAEHPEVVHQAHTHEVPQVAESVADQDSMEEYHNGPRK
ncbi:Sugar (and other) transporter [Rhizoctonia solani]|uniref:Sugar (And other) transporter n=1 Tax=Rhizoctonia solani TaxID=456999 RepID=A0A8H8P098_9AGAM|nr:Sugar (and other) transporter [Rhizoctonia solani]QRW22840.1 Sugar (and other) transporter [Rhizoctonia solani]